MAEIRLDLCRFDIPSVKKIFSVDVPMIATHRENETSDEHRMEQMKTAIDAGAKYIDLEIEAPACFRRELIDYANKKECEVIISYHNYETTPTLNQLESILNICFTLGGNIAKIATMVQNQYQLATLLGLYRHEKRLAVFGMGETGKLSRAMALLLGSEFTFAAPDKGKPTAPGQLTVSELKEIVNQLKAI
ncbi:MAG: type I 3-dehydroquinate dehydratase [Bacteroidota bacterium]